MNYFRASLWSALASLVQAAVVWIAFQTGLSRFNPDLNAVRLLIHLVVGQLAGYAFLLWFWSTPRLPAMAAGAVYGVILWLVLAVWLGPAVGYIPSPVNFGAGAIISTLVAFALYGLIVGYAGEPVEEDAASLK